MPTDVEIAQAHTLEPITTIAARAGLSKAGLYAHYRSKEEVFEDLLMVVLTPLEKLDVSFDADKPLDLIIEAYLDSLYPMLEQPITLATFRLLERCGLALRRRESATTGPAEWERLFPATGGALYGRASHGWAASLNLPR